MTTSETQQHAPTLHTLIAKGEAALHARYAPLVASGKAPQHLVDTLTSSYRSAVLRASKSLATPRLEHDIISPSDVLHVARSLTPAVEKETVVSTAAHNPRLIQLRLISEACNEAASDVLLQIRACEQAEAAARAPRSAPLPKAVTAPAAPEIPTEAEAPAPIAPHLESEGEPATEAKDVASPPSSPPPPSPEAAPTPDASLLQGYGRYAAAWKALGQYGKAKGTSGLKKQLTGCTEKEPFLGLSHPEACAAIARMVEQAKEDGLTLPGATLERATNKHSLIGILREIRDAHAALGEATPAAARDR